MADKTRIEDVSAGQPVEADRINEIRDAAVGGYEGSEGHGGSTGGFILTPPQRDPLWFPFKASGATIPAFGVFVGDGYETIGGRKVLKGIQATDGSDKVAYVAWGRETADGKFGLCTLATVNPTKAAYAGTAPDAGDMVGLLGGEWGVESGGTGFVCSEAGTTNIVEVVQMSRGTGGAWIEFTPDDDFTTADAAFSATVDAIHGNVPDDVDDTVTINNTKSGFEGGTTSLGFCANYDPATDAYYCINIGCSPA
jgi:hypothetical protein